MELTSLELTSLELTGGCGNKWTELSYFQLRFVHRPDLANK